MRFILVGVCEISVDKSANGWTVNHVRYDDAESSSNEHNTLEDAQAEFALEVRAEIYLY